MAHRLDRQSTFVEQLLTRARTIAIVGASPSLARHSHAVARYLADEGYEVLPIRPDQEDVGGLPAWRSLEDAPGQIDVAVIFRRPDAVPAHLEEAARRGIETVWLQPGTSSPRAERLIRSLGLTAIRDRCIAEDYRHLIERSAGRPRKLSAPPGRSSSKRRRKREGWVARGGGGRGGGGGVRSVLDEKKKVQKKR